jgi:hypothetical protein
MPSQAHIFEFMASLADMDWNSHMANWLRMSQARAPFSIWMPESWWFLHQRF